MYIRINTQIEKTVKTEGVISNALCPCCQTRSEILLCDISAQQQLRSGKPIGTRNHSKCSICNSCNELIVISPKKYAQIRNENSSRTYEEISSLAYEKMMIKKNMLPPYSKLSSKNFLICVLIEFFFGLMGGYNFYIGRIKRGLIQLTLFMQSIISFAFLKVFMAETTPLALIIFSCIGIIINVYWWLFDFTSILSHPKDVNGAFIMSKNAFLKKKNKWLTRTK